MRGKDTQDLLWTQKAQKLPSTQGPLKPHCRRDKNTLVLITQLPAAVTAALNTTTTSHSTRTRFPFS